ncbi:hypothetical protein [Teichococcus vastitatis]|uniref:PepSY domain-containing protein n=1 Tax=Teichococcus vastitatis TaxID=2307076 RepID=A0ABS9W5J8_9PROT|nr:hypothetical protein [Pseudoroseomonas vastitatis]MCI0754564.1 hypothetical protein [Pseudoroseomonas vastitatis]
MIRHLTLLGLLLAGAALPNPAAAREPNRDEAAAIAQALGAAGYRDWRKVDNARMADGSRHDLVLERESLRILHREREG